MARLLRPRLFSSACSVSITGNGKKLNLRVEGEEERRYHGLWLRHNCRCSECYSPATNMMKVRLSYVAECKEIESAVIKDDAVLVQWYDSAHRGVFPLNWLKKNDYCSEKRRRDRGKHQEPLVTESIPERYFNDIASSEEGTYSWLKDINYYGVSLVKGVPQPNNEAVKTLASKFPHLLPYYGEVYAVEAKEDISDLGQGTEELELHQDLLYYENPPGLQVFHCVRNDPCVEGGESLLLDLYPIVSELKKKHPREFETLTKVPVTFQRKIMNREEQFDLRMTCHHIALDRFDQVASINWNPMHSEPLCVDESFDEKQKNLAPNYRPKMINLKPDTEEEFQHNMYWLATLGCRNQEDYLQDLVERYYDAIILMSDLMQKSNLKFHHRLSPGETLVFNNRRFAHGRTKFMLNGGVRHFSGFYVHTDYIRSQFLVLGEKLGKSDLSTHAFMNTL